MKSDSIKIVKHKKIKWIKLSSLILWEYGEFSFEIENSNSAYSTDFE